MTNRKKLFRAGASAALLALLMPLQAWAQVVLLHTNDIHCGVDKNLTLARVAAYKKQQKAENPQTLLLDAGDAIQGEPLGKLTDGRAMVRILNAAGYDFAIPGNHEFDYGMDNFLSLAQKLKCGYTSCNFVRRDTGKPVLAPYRIFPFKERKVALIGVTTPGTLVSSTPRFFQDGKGRFIYGFCEDKEGVKLYRQVQDTVEEAREQGADTVILVSHLGSDGSIPVWSSRALLAHVTGVDGLIDGHSHEQYEVYYPDRKGKMIPVAQTGTKLQTLGRMVIEDDGTIRGELIRNLPAPDPKVETLVRKELAKVGLLFLILTSPGRTAPIMAVTMWSPASKFCAPQTICSGTGLPSGSRFLSPTSTEHTYMWSLSGCGVLVSTLAVTTWSKDSPTVSIASTSVPVRIYSSERVLGSSGISIMVLSQS